MFPRGHACISSPAPALRATANHSPSHRQVTRVSRMPESSPEKIGRSSPFYGGNNGRPICLPRYSPLGPSPATGRAPTVAPSGHEGGHARSLSPSQGFACSISSPHSQSSYCGMSSIIIGHHHAGHIVPKALLVGPVPRTSVQGYAVPPRTLLLTRIDARATPSASSCGGGGF